MGVRRGIDRKKVGCRSLIDANLEGQVGVNKFELYLCYLFIRVTQTLDRKDILHTLLWTGFRQILKIFYDNNDNSIECRKLSFVDVRIWYANICYLLNSTN